MPEIRTVNDILTALDHACSGDAVTVDLILDEIGHSSFAPALLVPALLLVSPLSGIPGMPTVGSVIMLLFAIQAILGVDHLWLPGVIRRRQLPCGRVSNAVGWLRKPAEWIDRRTGRRIAVLARPPWNNLVYVTIVLLCMIIPFLELLPMVTSVACFAISLFMIGIMVRDGLLVLFGYATVAGFAVAVVLLTQKLAGL
ncbi:exopolysaccharide biosynthesis protein [Celeribacter indicus]|uniref:Molybdate ABC transporter permease n=1 Tax=Celeribacter indicus TaxID=1208324 RepID=A0A0B5DXP2_9RHOB|nr:exopolysaccharide biosynthesis protein [Celeribacter indicus]AJE45017.1 molybdate ABC transporter permease [Celeribacter indicus]SDW94665.1 Uncharacterized conserved protein [Celeribacter indicus]